jgi:hypothetical protein
MKSIMELTAVEPTIMEPTAVEPTAVESSTVEPSLRLNSSARHYCNTEN